MRWQRRWSKQNGINTDKYQKAGGFMNFLIRSVIAIIFAGSSLMCFSAQEASTRAVAGVENDSYLLGAGDVLTIWALGADEISSKPYTVLPDGYLDLPLAGRVLASGKSVEQLKAELRRTLSQYFYDPQVSVTVTDFRSQPVSVLGSVNQPGVHQLQGGKPLLEVLSLAGGASPDADSTVIITRRVEWGPIPIPGATKDASGKFYVAKVDLQSVAQAKNPQDNIRIFPNDVIEVPKARLVYVLGEVTKPGGFVLHRDENVTAVQALSMAGGPTQFGSTKGARLLRASADSKERQEITVNLRQVLDGKGGDTIMHPEDILYIPGNASKKASLQLLQTGLQITTGLIIWRR
jgi:polysaccharide export outer membrane protein